MALWTDAQNCHLKVGRQLYEILQRQKFPTIQYNNVVDIFVVNLS